MHPISEAVFLGGCRDKHYCHPRNSNLLSHSSKVRYHQTTATCGLLSSTFIHLRQLLLLSPKARFIALSHRGENIGSVDVGTSMSVQFVYAAVWNTYSLPQQGHSTVSCVTTRPLCTADTVQDINSYHGQPWLSLEVVVLVQYRQTSYAS